MPSAVSPDVETRPNEADDLDRMLDYENAVEEFLNDLPIRDGNGQPAQPVQDMSKDEDQEVQVKRKRKPIPKLDEERLLSEAGLPRLRKITKRKLRFRGKNHEFSDISRLLNTYQLWLDDLYPRAKFRDGLTIIEKLGHSKRLQVMRKAWLDSTKPNRVETSIAEEDAMTRVTGVEDANETLQQANHTAEVSEDVENQGTADEDRPVVPLPTNDIPQQSSDQPDEDELDILLAENQSTSQPRQLATVKKSLPFEEDEDDEDELEALQAGHNIKKSAPLDPSRGQMGHNKDFADEEEMMAEMGDFW